MAIHIGNFSLGHCFVKDISSKKFIHKFRFKLLISNAIPTVSTY